MRSRSALAIVWLLATALATGVGFLATHTVGDVVRGTGPVGAEFRPDPSPGNDQPSGPSSPLSEAFEYPGGQLTVQCEGRVATLIERTSAPGWKVTDVERGPDEDVDVTFTNGDMITRIEVYCNEGQPRAVASDPT